MYSEEGIDPLANNLQKKSVATSTGTFGVLTLPGNMLDFFTSPKELTSLKNPPKSCRSANSLR